MRHVFLHSNIPHDLHVGVGNLWMVVHKMNVLFCDSVSLRAVDNL